MHAIWQVRDLQSRLASVQAELDAVKGRVAAEAIAAAFAVEDVRTVALSVCVCAACVACSLLFIVVLCLQEAEEEGEGWAALGRVRECRLHMPECECVDLVIHCYSSEMCVCLWLSLCRPLVTPLQLALPGA